MICVSDNNREKFCYVRTSAPIHLSRGPRGGGVQEAELRAGERGGESEERMERAGEGRGVEAGKGWTESDGNERGGCGAKAKE